VKVLEGDSEESDLSNDDFGEESIALSAKPRFHPRKESAGKPQTASSVRLQKTANVSAVVNTAEISELRNVGLLVGEFVLSASAGTWSATSQVGELRGC